jgi:hypothetical protein
METHRCFPTPADLGNRRRAHGGESVDLAVAADGETPSSSTCIDEQREFAVREPVRGGRIAQVFHPVFPPQDNAADVCAWLRAQRILGYG